jgi:hypothetical protein
MAHADRVRLGVDSNLREIKVCYNQEEKGACDEDIVVVLRDE